MGLTNFQNLEYSSLLPQAGAPGKDAFTFELFARDGKQMFHLDELEKRAGTVEVRIKSGKTIVGRRRPPAEIRPMAGRRWTRLHHARRPNRPNRPLERWLI